MNVIERAEIMMQLATEELAYRKEMLVKLKAIRAPQSVIENEIRLITRAAEICRLLDV